MADTSGNVSDIAASRSVSYRTLMLRVGQDTGSASPESYRGSKKGFMRILE